MGKKLLVCHGVLISHGERQGNGEVEGETAEKSGRVGVVVACAEGRWCGHEKVVMASAV